MIRVGVIGLGFMGRVHVRNWQAVPGAEVVAVCDADPEAINNLSEQTGNLEADSGSIDLTGATVYTSLDDMLEKENLDAVSITLPTFLHADFAVKALEQGLHVLCEKPMALSIEDCDRMIDAAETSGKKLMIAQCIRFWPEYAWLKQIVDSGEFGALKAADFSRLSAPPAWGDSSWFTNPSKSGGLIMDLHIHDVDYVNYLLGTPVSSSAQCCYFEGDAPGHVVTDFDYGNGTIVNAVGSWMASKSLGFKMGFNVVFDKATVVFDSLCEPALTVYPDEGDKYTPDIPEGDGYSMEIAHFVDLVTGKTDEPVITPEQARGSVEQAIKLNSELNDA